LKSRLNLSVCIANSATTPSLSSPSAQRLSRCPACLAAASLGNDGPGLPLAVLRAEGAAAFSYRPRRREPVGPTTRRICSR
jgi:hypothetical protein